MLKWSSKRKWILVGLAGTLCCAATTQARNIFGNDRRQDVEVAKERYAYPFEAIGKLNNGCTATLVGTRLALTAAHCVVNSETGVALDSLRELGLNLPGTAPKQTFAVKNAWVGTFSPVQKRLRDWAVIELLSPVPNDVVPLKLRAVDFSSVKLPFAVQLAGYSEDRRSGLGLSVDDACQIRDITKKKPQETGTQVGLLLHDCASASGISGAPVFVYDGDKALVVAMAVSERRSASVSVHRDEYSEDFANIAIPVEGVAPVIARLLETVDKGLKAPKLDGVFDVSLKKETVVSQTAIVVTPSSTAPAAGTSAAPTAVPAVSLSRLKLFSSRGPDVCLLDRNVGVVCFGPNTQTQRPSLTSPSAISSGAGHFCALQSTGVVCWGENRAKQTEAPALGAVTKISAGGAHTCALVGGSVKCWGFDGEGATKVPASLAGALDIAAGGSHTCALTSSGVQCWGDNTFGQTSVPKLNQPKRIEAGRFQTCALDAEGVKCWGMNGRASLGVPSVKNARALAVGSYHACVLADSGVQCWGDNHYGQLQVPVLKNPTQLVAADLFTCAADDSGVHCWGQGAPEVKVTR